MNNLICMLAYNTDPLHGPHFIRSLPGKNRKWRSTLLCIGCRALGGAYKMLAVLDSGPLNSVQCRSGLRLGICRNVCIPTNSQLNHLNSLHRTDFENSWLSAKCTVWIEHFPLASGTRDLAISAGRSYRFLWHSARSTGSDIRQWHSPRVHLLLGEHFTDAMWVRRHQIYIDWEKMMFPAMASCTGRYKFRCLKHCRTLYPSLSEVKEEKDSQHESPVFLGPCCSSARSRDGQACR